MTPVYPVLLVDGIRIKIRDGALANRVVNVVMGINLDGDRDILGLWVGPTDGESPKFWLSVTTELKHRGLLDVLVVCCDGLRGLPDAARAVWKPCATCHGQWLRSVALALPDHLGGVVSAVIRICAYSFGWLRCTCGADRGHTGAKAEASGRAHHQADALNRRLRNSP